MFASAAASGARQLRVFGSASRGQDRSSGDRGLLVDLLAGISLLHLVGLKLELEDALGIKADLCTECGLDPALRGRSLAEVCPS